MEKILDIHTHHASPQPEAVICCSPDNFSPVEGQLYSVGIHPWTVAEGVTDEIWEKLEEALSHPQVVALGECGIDIPKGGMLFKQMQVFKRQIDLSEKLGKPLIIHNVKAQDIIIGIKKDLRPTQPWLVHGFRGKPTIAKMFTDAGIYLSFGEYFNEATIAEIPENYIFAETDESQLTINQIIKRISAARCKDLLEIISVNTSNFLFHKG